MARSDIAYAPSPHTRRNIISLPETEALMADEGRVFHKSPERVLHFLARVQSTIEAYRAQIANLERDIQRLRLNAETSSRAGTVSPIESARFAPPEELARLVDSATQSRFGAAQRFYEEATALRAATVRDHSQLRFRLSGLLEDQSLPQRVRDTLATLLEAPAPADLTATKNAADAAARVAHEVLSAPAPAPVSPPAPSPGPAEPAPADLTALFD